MQGIVLVDKPSGCTSFDVVSRIRRLFNIKKVGHTGTLDPFATGVLPCLLGSATRAADLLPESGKAYIAKAKFKSATDTLDLTGRVVETTDFVPAQQEILNIIPSFTGEIMQLPPMYSAVSVNGKRLYQLARDGVTVERKKRKVTIDKFALLEFDDSDYTATFEVSCSKGTYIRTLIDDLARSLGSLAHLTELRRVKANGFDIKDCLTLCELEKLSEDGRLECALTPLASAFSSQKRLDVGQWQANMLLNGVPLMQNKLGSPAAGCYAVYCDKEFIGLCDVPLNGDGVKFKRLV